MFKSATFEEINEIRQDLGYTPIDYKTYVFQSYKSAAELTVSQQRKIKV